MPKFFEFDQNNSGGSFAIDDTAGIGPSVWIEAHSPDHANMIALGLGLYFDGVKEGYDCSCCGDRWYSVWVGGEGEDAPIISPEYSFNWHDTVYVHHLSGKIERIKRTGLIPTNSTEIPE